MRIAVDTTVLLDVFGADRRFGQTSREALRAAYNQGALVACDVVWAETRGFFPSDGEFDQAMGLLGIAFEPLGPAAAARAGELWARHRRTARGRVPTDFLIGAHATDADGLLTRDRGFYRRYFPTLRLLPSGKG